MSKFTEVWYYHVTGMIEYLMRVWAIKWVGAPSLESDEPGQGGLNPNDAMWRQEGHRVINPKHLPHVSNLIIKMRWT